MDERLRAHNDTQVTQGCIVSLIDGQRRGFVERINHEHLDDRDHGRGYIPIPPVRVRWMTLTNPLRDPLFGNSDRTFSYLPRELVVVEG